MKTKLYKKFVKLVCKDLKISKHDLFSRTFSLIVMSPYRYDFESKELVKLNDQLIITNFHHPLAQLWKDLDIKTIWFVKGWRHSHWKSYIQTKIDLGYKEKDVILDVLKKKTK